MLLAAVRRQAGEDSPLHHFQEEPQGQEQGVGTGRGDGPYYFREGLPGAGGVRVQQPGQPLPSRLHPVQPAQAGHSAAAADARVRRLLMFGVQQEGGAGNNQLHAVHRHVRVHLPVAHRGRRPAIRQLHASGVRQSVVQYTRK